MPLPPARREIECLTEGWPTEPGGPADFELSAFAAAFRSGRPELSAPALDRIRQQLHLELGRRGRSAARRRAIALRFRRFAPLAAAAAVVLGVGTWLHLRPGSSPGDSSRTKESPASIHGVPVIQARPADPTSRPLVN